MFSKPVIKSYLGAPIDSSETKIRVWMPNETEVYTLRIVHHGRTHGVFGTAIFLLEKDLTIFWVGCFFKTHLIRLDGTYYKCMCKTGNIFPHQRRISNLISWVSWICDSSSTVNDCGWGWKAKLKQYFSSRHSKFQEISNRTHGTDP